MKARAMKNTDYTKGTLRKQTEWDKNYVNLTPLTHPEPEPVHWAYKLLGVALAMLLLLSWVGAWIAEGMAT